MKEKQQPALMHEKIKIILVAQSNLKDVPTASRKNYETNEKLKPGRES